MSGYFRQLRPPNRARKELQDRLEREEPGHRPPPPREPGEQRREMLGMIALFLAVGGAILALAILD